ncbi:MAG: hypothetical protein WBB74_01385 [Gaiellaceae bacterium]
MKLVPLAALAAVVVLLVVPSTSSASPFIQYGVQDDAYLGSGPSVETKLETLDRLGVKLVRYTLNWREVARHKPARAMNPKDPAYDWAQADAILNGLRKHRITVLVTLYGAPAWANGDHAQNFIPLSKSALADFAYAAAKRYTWVTMWEVWNEPNLRRFLRPNSPSLYVQRLLNPTFAALHSLRRSNRVAGGATSPRPTPSGMSPVAFMRGMRAAHAHLDAYAHHPYPVTRLETPWGFAPGTCKYCTGVLTMANLPVLLREVKRDFGPKRVWLTEYGYQTNPPDRTIGVSYSAQAQYVSQGALRALEAPYVDVLIHFLIQDEPAVGRWQSGFLTRLGVIKPAFYAFMLPIAQLSRRGTRAVLWGQVRPRRGLRRYELERFQDGGWVSVGGVRYTNSRGSYLRTVKAARGARFRIYSPADDVYSRILTIR